MADRFQGSESHSERFRTLIDLKSFSIGEVEKIFSLAREFLSGKSTPNRTSQTMALLFFEPSTRTRMSFEIAGAELGLYPVRLDGGGGTSIEKGETIVHTILNVCAMKPKILVVRAGSDLNLHEIAQRASIPIVNAGWGVQGHPTQALLDAFTLTQDGAQISGHRLLIVGDIAHSRVAASHFELARILNYQVAVCGPESFLNGCPEGLKKFQKMEEALAWADSVMCLRVQKERHTQGYPLENYRREFGLTLDRLQSIGRRIRILHPGPVNLGVEIDQAVYDLPESLILKQVEMGVIVRKAILHLLLEGI
ncbi:MAG TPA: aspartate carbamoyltransferase catalytic subunit [Pseudobdellovibrionaceae bacterium]|nr:aspartate carbamoyltransferase catalytic subunit [Pseudobdellovibrionaceae bacterium]